MSRVVVLLGKKYDRVLVLDSVSLGQRWSSEGHANDPVVFLTQTSELISENGVPRWFQLFCGPSVLKFEPRAPLDC